MKKKRKKEDKSINHYMYFIIILILLLLALFIRFGFANMNNNLVPTGNVDIFELKTVCPKCTDNTCKCPNQETGLLVYENSNLVYEDQPLRIFTNPAYEFREILSPGASNTYVFKVKNSTGYNLKYHIVTKEENEHDINILYKLKRNGKYIIGNKDTYVGIDKLTTEDIILKTDDVNDYELIWKWVESENDTLIGNSINVSYQLRLTIEGEEVE